MIIRKPENTSRFVQGKIILATLACALYTDTQLKKHIKTHHNNVPVQGTHEER